MLSTLRDLMLGTSRTCRRVNPRVVGLGAIALASYLTAACGSPIAPDDQSLTFSIAPSVAQIIRRGESATYQITVLSKGNINADVQFTAVNLASGLAATFAPARLASTQQTTQLVVSTADGTAYGTYRFTVQGRLFSNGQSASTGQDTRVDLDVSPRESGFNLLCELPFTIAANATATLACYVRRDTGFSSDVDLSFVSIPSYLRFAPETARISTSVGGFAFTVSRTTAASPASFNLTLRGTSGGLTREVIVPIQLPGGTATPGV